MKISVIPIFYKSAEYVKKCVDSILCSKPNLPERKCILTDAQAIHAHAQSDQRDPVERIKHWAGYVYILLRSIVVTAGEVMP